MGMNSAPHDEASQQETGAAQDPTCFHGSMELKNDEGVKCNTYYPEQFFCYLLSRTVFLLFISVLSIFVSSLSFHSIFMSSKKQK